MSRDRRVRLLAGAAAALVLAACGDRAAAPTGPAEGARLVPPPLSVRLANPNPLTPSTSALKEGQSFALGFTSPPSGLEFSFWCGNGGWTAWSTNPLEICPGLPNDGTYTLGGRVRNPAGGMAVTRITASVDDVLPVVAACSILVDANGWIKIGVSFNDVPADRAMVLVYWSDPADPSSLARDLRPVRLYGFSHRYWTRGFKSIEVHVIPSGGGPSSPCYLEHTVS